MITLGLLACAAGPATSQATREVRIEGRAIDPQGRPMADLEVLLHRVDAMGGSSLDATTTDSTGAFSVTADATVDTSAVYFAAARFDDQLYIGPFLREPDGSTPYILVVGGEPVSLGDPAAPTMLPPVSPGDGPRRRLLVLLPLTGLLGVAAWALARGVRPDARRRAIMRIAVIDEDLARDGADPQLESERDRLMERLLTD
jgi:hypothetical protein